MGRSDAAYRRLFQHRELLRDLLACVLGARLFKQLDWDSMEPVPTSLVGDQLQQRTGDGAWKVPYHRSVGARSAGPMGPVTGSVEPVASDAGRAVSAGSPSLYILLVFEHQSQPDTVMALRLSVYAGLLYQNLLRDGQLALPLPPVLPVVFYSGKRPWRAPLELAELVGEVPSDLRRYQPQMRYLLIEERQLMRNAGLPEGNLAALLLRLKDDQDLEQWHRLLHTLVQTLKGPQYEELNRSFTVWLLHVVQRNARHDQALPQVDTLQELDMMIAEKAPGIWARQWLKEGRVEGQADLLLRQLQRRFGVVSEDVSSRVRTASAADLENWSLNILDAVDVDDVFRD